MIIRPKAEADLVADFWVCYLELPEAVRHVAEETNNRSESPAGARRYIGK